MNNLEDLFVFDVCDRYIWSHWSELFEMEDVEECVEVE